ncbi:TPA: hypothetical protein HA281_04175 [Candidatus Woesearchaeota archaeon]|nr:hypothetical protein [Candidatus Woesearchaeota archaeon]HII64786.1 hypothetical protein [Candidatus Woesearchaeota archaeon]
MSKRKCRKAVESIQFQIDEHRLVKLKKAQMEGNIELAGYYVREIERLEEQLREKKLKLLTRNERVRVRKRGES